MVSKNLNFKGKLREGSGPSQSLFHTLMAITAYTHTPLHTKASHLALRCCQLVGCQLGLKWRTPNIFWLPGNEPANDFLSNETQGRKLFMSGLMNELFRSSELIAFGIQRLVKAHINSKQWFFGFAPQLKQYVTCSQPDSALGHTQMSPTVVNENYGRISGE